MNSQSQFRETIGSRLTDSHSPVVFDDLSFSKEYLSNLQKIYIVACGTAMHAGLVGKAYIRKFM